VCGEKKASGEKKSARREKKVEFIGQKNVHTEKKNLPREKKVGLVTVFTIPYY
jgi:hypothetical protein